MDLHRIEQQLNRVDQLLQGPDYEPGDFEEVAKWYANDVGVLFKEVQRLRAVEAKWLQQNQANVGDY